VNQFEFQMKTGDGLLLRGRGWEPDAAIQAVVCVLHGLGEHAGRYADLAGYLGCHGIAVTALDLRGHGRSEGRRGHAPNYAALMADIDLLLEEAASRYPDAPVFLFGHSLGGNLAVYSAMKTSAHLTGVIVSAPLLRLSFQPPKWKALLLDVLYALHLSVPMRSGLERDALTRDSDVLNQNRRDPLAHKWITPQLGVEMLRNGEWMVRNAAEFSRPILLMHGTADRVTSVEASREFAAAAGPNCTLKTWDGFYHELHNEPEHTQVFDYMRAWIDHTLL
jgi:alpha-beta hydrolase superfamily lysophospholipase